MAVRFVNIDGKNLKELRENKNLSIDSLCELTVINSGLLKKIETGEVTRILEPQFNRLVIALGCTPEYLHGETNMNEENIVIKNDDNFINKRLIELLNKSIQLNDDKTKLRICEVIEVILDRHNEEK